MPPADLWSICPRPGGGWMPILTRVLAQHPSLGPDLAAFLAARSQRLLPPAAEVFTALDLTPLDRVRVVILGQDPYPTPTDAHGLAFSIRRPGRLPRSLSTILQEVQRDTGMARTRGDLSDWARQGVLLLNSVLTFESPPPDGEALAHRGRGWEQITNALLQAILRRPVPCVVMAWGLHAGRLLAQAGTAAGPVLILTATHPSPLSCRRPAQNLPAFCGSGHFSRANAFLVDQGLPPIVWGEQAQSGPQARATAGGR